MKTILFLIFLFPLTTFFSPIELKRSTSDIDYSMCLKKYDSNWGEPCLQCSKFNNSYRISLMNVCTESIDVKVAVQEADKRWKIFTKLEMAAKDTMIAYACDGLGKYLYWARKAGDRSNEFPSDEEINTLNSK